MPQFVPYTFINQLSFTFLGIVLLTYAISFFILPKFVELFVTRMYITKLLLY